MLGGGGVGKGVIHKFSYVLFYIVIKQFLFPFCSTSMFTQAIIIIIIGDIKAFFKLIPAP